MSRNAEVTALQENEMGLLPVGKLLRKMALPLIFSMFVQVLYGLVDSMYVAQIGDSALTAISLCMPVQYLVLGVGIGIGVGVNSILSKKLGEKDERGVNQAAGNGFVLVWIASILFIIMGLFAIEPFYRMQTDIPALRIIAASLLLTTTTQILTGFLQALGRGTDSFVIAITQAVFLLLAAWLLSLTGSVVLVWLAFPIMEVLRFIIGVFLVRRTYKNQIMKLEVAE